MALPAIADTVAPESITSTVRLRSRTFANTSDHTARTAAASGWPGTPGSG